MLSFSLQKYTLFVDYVLKLWLNLDKGHKKTGNHPVFILLELYDCLFEISIRNS